MKKMIALLLAAGLLAGCTPQGQDQPRSSGAVSSVPAPVQYEQVTLFLPNETAEGQTTKTVQIEQTEKPAVELVQALEIEGALPEGTEVLDVRQTKSGGSVDQQDRMQLSVDLNKAFEEGIQKTGTTGEAMILASLVNTLWAYYEPAEIVLTVEGQPLETGHNIYEKPFTEMYLFE